MNSRCTLQLFANGAWYDVGSVLLLGAEEQGWRSKTYTGYSVEWAIEHGGVRNAHAFGSRFPVGLQEFVHPHWPVFLIDMLPQGFGREELLRRLGLPVTAGESVDWRLLLAGAGNPVGNLRVKEAATWLTANAGPVKGFTDDEVAERGDDFAEYLASHGLFVAGSSGVQGEWPKILLTRADDGLLYLDHTLADERARQHYIVKFGRGSNEALAAILRHEAPYMALARMLGLRVHAELVMLKRALFIPRFDRQVTGGRVLRLAQESIATLTGNPGFDTVPSHDDVCCELLRQCTHPLTEVLEYIKRDVANLALGNKDNHARNTAIQRDFSGGTCLTPLYDFAPMYLHPDGIARRIRWEGNDGGAPDWNRVIDKVCELAQTLKSDKQMSSAQKKALGEVCRPALVEGLRSMAQPLKKIAAHGTDFGLEPAVHAHLKLGIEAQAQRLTALN